MRNALRPLAVAGTLLVLTACQTTDEDEWVSAGVKPFDQALTTCEEQTEAIREADERETFFVNCMAALGWVPRAG